MTDPRPPVLRPDEQDSTDLSRPWAWAADPPGPDAEPVDISGWAKLGMSDDLGELRRIYGGSS